MVPSKTTAPLSLGLLLVCCFPSCEVHRAESGRVVLTVVFDALHAGHVHHLGYERETTPNLDALAAQGVTFTRASAPAPYTVASTVSLMTGLQPERHGVLRSFGPHTRPLGSTLAEILSAANWQCYGATANANAGERNGLSAGFEVWVAAYEGPGEQGEVSLEYPDGSSVHMVSPNFWPTQLERFLALRNPSRDTFIYLHVLQPHSPYNPPRELLERFADPNYKSSWSDEDTPQGFAAGETAPLVLANQGKLKMTAADRRHTIDLYGDSLL